MNTANEKEPEYIENPELVIGLVGPVGLQWDQLSKILEEEFRNVNYAVAPIQISRLIEEIFGNTADENEYKRISRLMDQGDYLRETLKHSNAVGLLAVAAIQRAREHLHMTEKDQKLPNTVPQHEFANVPLSRYAFVLRSLKTPEEVELLRMVYGDCFFLIAGYSSQNERRDALADKISASCGESDSVKYYKDADDLMTRDEKDREKKHGQNVRDTFALADFFVDMDNISNLSASIQRFAS